MFRLLVAGTRHAAGDHPLPGTAVGMEAEGSKMHKALGLHLNIEAGAATTIAWSIDTVRKRDEYQPPHPLTPAVGWNEPDGMRPIPGVTKRMELDRLTPVFSTALLPKGLSGFIRRIAYQIPESHARHWATLMLADRVDVFEHRIAKLVKLMVLVPAGTAAAVLIVAKVAGRSR